MGGVVAGGLAKTSTVQLVVGPIHDRFVTLMDHRNQLVHGLWSGPDGAGQTRVSGCHMNPCAVQ